MPSKQCGKCGEMVDEAKAFCPGCGNAFVEEKTRVSVSDFDLSEHTVKLGETMYNQMLSDMGLNISKEPNRTEPKVESVAAAVRPAPDTRPERTATPPAPIRPSDLKSVIIAVVIAFAVLAVIAVAFFAVLYFR